MQSAWAPRAELRGVFSGRGVESARPSSLPTADDPIVVFLIAAKRATEVLPAEDNDMIQAIPADRTDGPWDVTIVKSGQLHLLRLIKPRSSRLLMFSILFMGVNSRS